MNTITHKINLNISQPNNFEYIHAMQGDYNGENIEATLYDGNKLYTIDCDEIILQGKTKNGHIILLDNDDITVSENKQIITFPLTKTILSEYGDIDLSISFIDRINQKKKTIFPFILRNLKETAGDTAVSELKAITDYVLEAKKSAEDSARSALISNDSATNAILSEQNALEYTESANISAINATESEENALKSANKACNYANDAEKSAESSANSASMANSYFISATNVANTAMKCAMDANISEEKAQISAESAKESYGKIKQFEEVVETNIANWDDKYTKNEVDNKFSTLETSIDWKEAVNTFSDIAKSYPNPDDGWTVNVKDMDYTYRYNGSEWIAISANAIPKATQNVDGLLSKEDKTLYDDANSKKHSHSNKAVLDGLKTALITGWNDAVSHISDTIKHITETERTLWNTVSNKVDKVSGKQLSTNDYTVAEKTKLANIESGAEINTITGIKGNAESTYRTGNVNIKPEDIGLLDNTYIEKEIELLNTNIADGLADKVKYKTLYSGDAVANVQNTVKIPSNKGTNYIIIFSDNTGIPLLVGLGYRINSGYATLMSATIYGSAIVTITTNGTDGTINFKTSVAYSRISCIYGW